MWQAGVDVGHGVVVFGNVTGGGMVLEVAGEQLDLV